MEFLLSKRLGHADELSKLIPRLCDPLEESVTAALREKSVTCSNIRELPVTLKEIWNKETIEKYITEKKKQILN